uniref:Secretory peptide n=1 Tax=Panagrellus redivivus TaxID=6233 RepID=A0A7E4ZTN0_PANRE
MLYQVFFLIVLLGSTHAIKYEQPTDVLRERFDFPPENAPAKVGIGHVNNGNWVKNQHLEAEQFVTPIPLRRSTV